MKKRKQCVKVHRNVWWWGKSNTIITHDGVGHVTVSIENENPMIAVLSGLSVMEEFRKQGYGSELLKLAEEEASGMGAAVVKTYADPESFVVQWYERLGFVRCGEHAENENVVLVELEKQIG